MPQFKRLEILLLITECPKFKPGKCDRRGVCLPYTDIVKYRILAHELQEKDLLVCDHFFQILKELQIGFCHADVGGEFFAVRFGDLKFDDHVFLNSMPIDSPPERRKFRVVSGESLPGVLELQKHHWVYAQNIFLFLEVMFRIRMQR